jgi:quercetin 2,3-dioxygenase
MIRKIEAARRYKADHGWLTAYHLFSFAMYQDRGNLNFGILRVFNDDYIDAHKGFGAHDHDNMEIVTIVHEGELTHQDSMGNTGKITAGDVQYMSAGTGVTHAEFNNSDEQIHGYQIWIFPEEQNLTPTYGHKDFSNSPVNEFVPVASGQNKDGAIPIKANATIYKATLEKDKTIRYQLNENRGLFVYVKEGSIDINRTTLEKEDQARIMDETDLIIKANETAEFIAIDVSMHLPF